MKDLLQFKNKVFVETGTWKGDTLNTVLSSGLFETLISLELSVPFFKESTERFRDYKTVKLYNSNSKTELYTIIKDITTPITFWLDSHWSGIPDVASDEVICPILEELEQIRTHSINTHTIMIDDVRLMNGNLDRYKGFPVTLTEIIKKLYEINSDYKIKYFDDYCSTRDILVAYL